MTAVSDRDVDNLLRAVHERLHELMGEQGLTVEEMAARIDCDPAWLRKQLPNPWVETLAAVCDVLGVCPSEVLAQAQSRVGEAS